MSNLYRDPDLAGGRPLSASEYDRSVDDGDSAFGGVMRGGAHTTRVQAPVCGECGNTLWQGVCFRCRMWRSRR